MTRHFTGACYGVHPTPILPRLRILMLVAVYLTQIGDYASMATPVVSNHPLEGRQGTFFIPLQRLGLTNPPPPPTHGKPTSSMAPMSRRHPSKRGLTRVEAVERVGYAGEVLIGTPPQRFPLLFDTGSDLVLVTSDACQGEECPALLHYSCEASSTCGKKRLDTMAEQGDQEGGGGGGVNREEDKVRHSHVVMPHNRASTAQKEETFLQIAHATHPTSDVQRFNAAKAVRPLMPKASQDGSSSSGDFYNQSYVDGTWGAGYFVQDHVQLDSTAGLLPPDANKLPDGHGALITFLNVVQDNLDLVRVYNGQVAGLLGLLRASRTKHKTFLQALVEQGSLAQPMMSMHLEENDGSFLLGGMDPQGFEGDMIFSRVTDPIDWQISVQGLGIVRPPGAINSTTTSSTATSSGPELSIDKIDDPHQVLENFSAVLDSGASGIMVPVSVSELLHHRLGGHRDANYPDMWILPCQGPDLVWWVSGYGLVQPYDRLVNRLKSGRCQSLIFEMPDLDYWILGDNWLRGLYIVYDMAGSGRIGIAIGHRSPSHLSQGELDSRVSIIPNTGQALSQGEISGVSTTRPPRNIVKLVLAAASSVFTCWWILST